MLDPAYRVDAVECDHDGRQPRRFRLRTKSAAYVNDTIELSQHWKLIGGLRWDRFAGAASQHDHRLPAYASQTDYFTSVRAGRDLSADRLAVVLRVVRHVVRSVARNADGHQPDAGPRAGNEPGRTKSAASGICWAAMLRSNSALFQRGNDQRAHAGLADRIRTRRRHSRRRLPVRRDGPHHRQVADLRRLHATWTRKIVKAGSTAPRATCRPTRRATR